VEKTKSAPYTSCMPQVKTGKRPSQAAVAPDPLQPFQSESFSLAHLSDLHLTTLENVKVPQLLSKRMLGYCSWRRKRRVIHRLDIVEALLDDLRANGPDHIAVTGDLTHLGLPDEFAEAGQWLARLGPPERVTVIPGNHEAYVGRAWDKSCVMWAPYLASNRNFDIPKAAGYFPSLRVIGQVALIGLCSARPSLPFLAIGSLGKKQLAGLEALLSITGKEGLLRVILIHHPPAPGTIKWRKRLIDSRTFAAIVARCGAELVLHGHAHAPTLSAMPTPLGKIPVIGAPSASELCPWSGRYAKYHIYRMRQDGINRELTMIVRGYSEALGRFTLEKEATLSIPQLR
jgi:3',5'-cyclic AMP phosphodiesterase CpdA